MKKEQNAVQDEALFEKLADSKKKKKRKLIIIIVIIAAAVAAGLIIAFNIIGANIAEQANQNSATIESAQVTKGSISTVVSGYGTIDNVDVEELTVPAGVDIDEVVVSANDTVKAGDLIATVDSESVAEAISTAQTKLDEYDKKLEEANSNTVSTSVTAGVAGRVKEIFASPGDSVVDCMAQNGALITLSTDGYMSVTIDAGSLTEGETVTVVLPDGTEYSGTVSNVILEKAKILISDDGPNVGDNVTVKTTDGQTLGEGTLEINNPLAVTAYAGTIKSVNTSLNAKVSASTSVITLQDTQFSASYETILRERNQKEEELLELLTIYKNGGLVAPMDGCICSVEYSEDSDDSSTSTDQKNVFDSIYDSAEKTESSNSTSSTTEEQETVVVKMSSNENMIATIEINETDILSVQEGQSASVIIYSIGEDTFEGTVTGIKKTASTSDGTTTYSAEITIEKTEQMLSGMSCEASIQIEGVDDALLIPVEALNQTSETSYVYTKYNESTKELEGQVEVETGLSDDSNIEITSGLNEGDTVYYESYSDMWSEFEDNFGGGSPDMGSFGGGNGFDMGSFGGGAPDMGGGGNMGGGPGMGGAPGMN